MADDRSRFLRRREGSALRTIDNRAQPAEQAAGERDEPAALLRLSARGDTDAFTRLYDLTSPTVHGIIRRVLRNPAQAEEVTQEVFVEIWRTCARFDPTQAAGLTWMVTIAHRRAVDRVRREESQSARIEKWGVREQATIESAPDAVVDAITDEMDRARVKHALHLLTPVQRESVEMAYYGGYTHAEIADVLDLPLGTVKTRIRDGLIRLRDALGESA